MKAIIIGLGNFGSSLGLRLVEDGHEVIGVDCTMDHVNLLQDKLTYTICMDTTNELAVQKLPLSDADYVIVSIGEDVGNSITTIALIKKLHPDVHIIGRAISNIHHTIMEAMGVSDIIHPEAEYAADLANRLVIKGALKSLSLDNKFEIVEVNVPRSLIGRTVLDSNLRRDFQLNLVTLIRQQDKRNLLGTLVKSREVIGVPAPDTMFAENDILVLFGKLQDIEDFLEKVG